MKRIGMVLFAMLAAAPCAHAAKLSAADKAWIDTCVKQRKGTAEGVAALRRYCVCMHEVVEDNRPFAITELERNYPPAHRSCRRKSGRR